MTATPSWLGAAPPYIKVYAMAKAFNAFRGIDMEDFPIWLKLLIWGTIGLTVGYALYGMIVSFTQS